MRIKKVVSFALVVAMLFALAISTFAEARALNGGEYTAGTVKHRFITSASATKTSSQSWHSITDNASYSYFYTDDEEVEGYHYTYLVDASGSRMSSTMLTISFSGVDSFYSSDLDKNSTSNTAKLQIYNPNYSSSGTTLVLKTKGLLIASAS